MTDPTAHKLIQRLADDLGLWLEYNQAPSNLPDEEERSLALVLEARRYLRYASTHPRPIPVAERLPTAADCDEEGRCWFWFWDSYIPRWELDDRTHGINVTQTAWLPAAALPLPEASP
jgi:hypothetical protein